MGTYCVPGSVPDAGDIEEQETPVGARSTPATDSLLSLQPSFQYIYTGFLEAEPVQASDTAGPKGDLATFLPAAAGTVNPLLL